MFFSIFRIENEIIKENGQKGEGVSVENPKDLRFFGLRI